MWNETKQKSSRIKSNRIDWPSRAECRKCKSYARFSYMYAYMYLLRPSSVCLSAASLWNLKERRRSHLNANNKRKYCCFCTFLWNLSITPHPLPNKKENKIELTQRNWKSGKYLKWKVKKNEPQQLKSCTVVTTRKSRAREKSMRMNEWVVGCLMMHGCWLHWVGEWCIYIYVCLVVVVEKESALFCLHRSGSFSPLKDDNVTFEFDETFVYIFISPTDKFMLGVYMFFFVFQREKYIR